MDSNVSYFHPDPLGEMIQFDYSNIFQTGLNHQLGMFRSQKKQGVMDAGEQKTTKIRCVCENQDS